MTDLQVSVTHYDKGLTNAGLDVRVRKYTDVCAFIVGYLQLVAFIQ